MSKSNLENNNNEFYEENIENNNSTEENVINDKNKIFHFSSINFTKYKKYTLNIDENELNNEKITRQYKTENINNNYNISNINATESENIGEENIMGKINIYSNIEENKNDLNKEKNSDIFEKNAFESQIPSEELFIRQKEQIKFMKEKNNQYRNNNLFLNMNENKNNFIGNKLRANKKNNSRNKIKELNLNLNDNKENQYIIQNFDNLIKQRKSFRENGYFITLDSPQFFEITDIEKNNNINEQEEGEEEENDIDRIPKINNNWQIVQEFKKINNYIEFNNIALRTLNEVNYNTNGVEINIELSLIGDGEFYIFSRCFVNKDINDSEIFDNLSINNEGNVMFNKYTSLIKISKEKNSNKCFLYLGTFYEDETDENKIKYETFLKRQLVDYNNLDNINVNNSNSIYYYLENDLLDVRIIIIDLGSETIDAKIFLNNNEKCNHIEGKFYLPTIKRSKLLFCGNGQSVPLRKLRINNIEKNDETDIFDIKKSCTCCNIF